MVRAEIGGREKDQVFEMDKVRHQAVLASLTKYRFFFSGLIFAVLSYSLQKPITSDNLWLIWFENISWALLLVSGLLALKECGNSGDSIPI